jgi:general secretion pathway protein A
MGSLIEVAPEPAQPGATVGGPFGGAAGRAPAASPVATDRTPRGRSAEPAGTVPAAPAATANAARTPAAWQMESQVALERLWSLYEDSPAPPGLCDPDVEPSVALACVSELARGWGEVRAFDRPLLLDLVREDGGSAGAVLLGIEGNSAMLLAGSGWRLVALPELALRWSGEYRFLWRPPAGYRYPLALWADSPVVLEIAQMFARLDGQPAPLSGEVFNSALDSRVRLFQERHGLAVDGVVGVRTLLKLNQALGTDPGNAEIRQSLALAGQ